MRRIVAVTACCWVCSAVARASGPGGDYAAFWPQWRGPEANGVAAKSDPPIEWSESKNVRWKVELPGQGHATPIVWGERVYVQTAVKAEQPAESERQPGEDSQEDSVSRRGDSVGRSPESGSSWSMESQPPERRRRRGRAGGWGQWRQNKPTHVHKFLLLALDRRSGWIVWETTLCEEVPHAAGHPDSSQASNSPVTDGEYIYAYFGSRGLYCLDLEGKLRWKKDLGDMETRLSFGEGSSPALGGDTIVVNWDHEGDSFIVALDKKTGKQRWKVDRDESTSWATPIIVEHEGKPQVITAASGFTRGYDLASGKLLWQCVGLTSNVISSPVSAFGMVYVMSGHRGNNLQAIALGGAAGDITGSEAVVWQHDKGTPYTPSPLLYGEALYFLKRNDAILSCFDARTGRAHYTRQRLPGVEGVFASPVGAGDRVYIVGKNGTTVTLKHGPAFEVLATNLLDDTFTASPAIAGRELYLRGHKNLYCLAAP